MKPARILSEDIRKIAESQSKSRSEKIEAIHSLLLSELPEPAHEIDDANQAYQGLGELFSAFEQASQKFEADQLRRGAARLRALRRQIDDFGRTHEALTNRFSKTQRDFVARKLATVQALCERYQILV